MSRTYFSFSVVIFSAALAVFFAVTDEPNVNLGLVGLFWALVLLMMAYLSRHVWLHKSAWAVIIFAVGFAWAQFITLAQYRATGTPPDGPGTLDIAGVVTWSEPRAHGSLVDITLHDARGHPYGLRLYGKQVLASTLRPGCHVQLGARLSPLAKPVVVGGYDPRFVAWFDGRRGQGFIRDVHAIDCSAKPNLRQRLARWRLQLAAHYRAYMSDEAGPVAAALVTGVRGKISASVRDAFRHSGLAHMLAISGLHMALFAGSIYALLRYGAALWPWLVLRYDVRKPSAIVALLAATGYLMLSGASFATQRAYIMLAIFFLAILLDRPAITMRNVLWAALLVLVIQPHAIVQVGFQMSFAAVMALVSAYELWQKRDRFYVRLADMTPRQRALSYVRRYSAALAFTSLIAGTATGLVAILHFYRIGVFGLPANLVAMPIFGTLIMPMAPLSLLAAPLGGDAPFLATMQFGIWLIIEWAQYLTGFEGAVRFFGASPDWVLPLMATGFLCLVLGHRRWRYIGLPILLLAVLSIGRGERPLLHFIGRDLIVAQDSSGQLHVLRNRGRDYELQRIEEFHGQKNIPVMDCDKGCGLMGHDRRIIAYLTNPKRLTVACRNSHIVILPFQTVRYPCKATVIDETHLPRNIRLQVAVDGRSLDMKKPANGRFWQR